MVDKYTYEDKEIDYGNTSVDALGFEGEYEDWDEASLYADGYDADEIYKKACDSSLAVFRGEAMYERDTVKFYDNYKYFPLLYYVEKIKNSCGGGARILDFGGGLGSMYFQHRELMGAGVSWNIVEQSEYVRFGMENLKCKNLKFNYFIEDVGEYDMAIFGSSLQYLENYNEYLDKVLDSAPRIIFVDRTPMSSRSWISVERVHEPIYEASYPIRIFDRKKFDETFISLGYKLETEWYSNVTGLRYRWKNNRVIFESMAYVKDYK